MSRLRSRTHVPIVDEDEQAVLALRALVRARRGLLPRLDLCELWRYQRDRGRGVLDSDDCAGPSARLVAGRDRRLLRDFPSLLLSLRPIDLARTGPLHERARRR